MHFWLEAAGLQMMGAMAQYEKSQIVLTLRGVRMRKRAKEARCEV
jgi:hypothetical protein